jgi:hypothetical protein
VIHWDELENAMRTGREYIVIFCGPLIVVIALIWLLRNWSWLREWM